MTQEQAVSSAARPLYEHDCDKCVYLGPFTAEGIATRFDLWFCGQGGRLPTVIARWSSDGPDYTSGIALADHDPVLFEARERARAKGLIQ